VTDYSSFAKFYDRVMGEPTETIERLSGWIDKYAPGAQSLLELGCGTGSVLAGLRAISHLTGLDRSPQMLEIARGKVPFARLVQDDLVSFHLEERFDVVVCVFDTINHLPSLAAWKDVYDRVADHLVPGGLFIFDVNTLSKLRRLGDGPPWVHDFDGNVLIMNVECDGRTSSVWDIRVFEQFDDGRFRLHHERINELGVPLDDIRSALQGRFDVLGEHDPDDQPPSEESSRVYFVCRRTNPAQA
jgi:SAM-dependent methyltransferase